MDDPQFFNGVNKLWYIMGDKGCGQFHQNCVWFQKRKQIHIMGGQPQYTPIGANVFDAMNKLWYMHDDERCGKVSSKL